jgi:hypothetical protein
MRIVNDTKLDFSDVLIVPKRSTLASREEVSKMRKSHGSRFGYEQKPIVMKGDDNPSKRKDVRAKISEQLTGRNITWADKISESCKGRTAWNKGKSVPSSTTHMNVNVKCPHCHKEGFLGAMKRWHFNNCKKIVENP